MAEADTEEGTTAVWGAFVINVGVIVPGLGDADRSLLLLLWSGTACAVVTELLLWLFGGGDGSRTVLRSHRRTVSLM